jgi:hypothetical protein
MNKYQENTGKIYCLNYLVWSSENMFKHPCVNIPQNNAPNVVFQQSNKYFNGLILGNDVSPFLMNIKEFMKNGEFESMFKIIEIKLPNVKKNY